jgi:hypothetical protein
VVNAIPATAGAVNDTYIQSGAVTPAKISTGGPSWTSGGNLSFNSGYGSSAVAYGCRAWVNFNGTGTVAIRASGNVTSITDSGAGDYIVNFTTAMPDANYSTVASCGRNGTGSGGYLALPSDKTAQTASAVQVYTITTAGATPDTPIIFVAIFR